MDINSLKIENIQKSVKEKKIIWTKHCLNRLNQRNILISDVKNALNSGKILEYYNDDYPYPSCLVLGHTINKDLIHVVCGINEDRVFIITAYYPNIENWEKDMKTRRKK